METPPAENGIPPEILADLEEAAGQAASGGVREPSATAREELRQRYGLGGVAGSLIHEAGEEEYSACPINDSARR